MLKIIMFLMKLSIYSISLKNISRNSLRTVIVILSAIFITFIISFTLISSSLIQGAIKNMNEKLGADLIVIPEGSETETNEFLFLNELRTFYMSKNIYEKLKNYEEIDKITYQIWLVTLPSLCCGVADIEVIAIDPETDFIIKPFLEKKLELLEGTAYAGYEAWLSVLGGVIDTAVLYQKEFKIIDKLEKTGTGLDYALYIGVDDFRKIAEENPYIEAKPDQISVIFIKLKEDVDENKVIEKIKNEFPNVEVLRKSDLGENLKKIISSISSSLLIVALIIFPLSLLVILNLTFITINERKKEIGILKALGANNSSIIKILFIENFFMVLPSILIGFSLALILSLFLIHSYLKAYLPILSITHLLETLIISSLSIMIIIIVATIISIRKIFKTETLTLLKEKE